jgi:hypothetical protein
MRAAGRQVRECEGVKTGGAHLVREDMHAEGDVACMDVDGACGVCAACVS